MYRRSYPDPVYGRGPPPPPHPHSEPPAPYSHYKPPPEYENPYNVSIPLKRYPESTPHHGGPTYDHGPKYYESKTYDYPKFDYGYNSY